MQRVAFVLAVACLGTACSRGSGSWTVSASEPSPPSPTTVLVDLFTSEGCSSCPPADAALTDLVRDQPISNITVIAMSEHVDYWDRLGWRDPYSSAAFSSRQSDYDAHTFHTGTIYTPQLVIDGRFQEIGSDRRAVARAITRAAHLVKADVHVAPRRVGTTIRAEVRVDFPQALSHETADIIVAVVEDGLVTKVERGENRGRTLAHSRVARHLTVVGRVGADQRTVSSETAITVPPESNGSALHVVAFVQERTTRHVVGVSSAPIPVS